VVGHAESGLALSGESAGSVTAISTGECRGPLAEPPTA